MASQKSYENLMIKVGNLRLCFNQECLRLVRIGMTDNKTSEFYCHTCYRLIMPPRVKERDANGEYRE